MSWDEERKAQQAKCEHLKTTELARTWEEYPRNGGTFYSELILHLRCKSCGLFFGRNDWKAKRIDKNNSTDEGEINYEFSQM